jgi:hypothetical protein
MKKLNRRGSGTTFCQAFQMHTASSMYIMKKKANKFSAASEN